MIFFFSKNYKFSLYFVKISGSFPLIGCVHMCVGGRFHHRFFCTKKQLLRGKGESAPNKPSHLPSPRLDPFFFSQMHSRRFLEACQLGCGPRAQRRQQLGVLGGLNQVCSKFRWSGTEWSSSAQFKMIGLAPCAQALSVPPQTLGQQKSVVAPPCQLSRCFLRRKTYL